MPMLHSNTDCRRMPRRSQRHAGFIGLANRFAEGITGSSYLYAKATTIVELVVVMLCSADCPEGWASMHGVCTVPLHSMRHGLSLIVLVACPSSAVSRRCGFHCRAYPRIGFEHPWFLYSFSGRCPCGFYLCAWRSGTCDL